MKPTSINMKCLILGHNYYKDDSNQSNKVYCKNCGAEASINSNGDIISDISEDKVIEQSFRKLFLLNRSLNSGY